MFFAIYYKVVPTHVSEWLMFFGDEYWVKTGGCSYGLWQLTEHQALHGEKSVFSAQIIEKKLKESPLHMDHY